MNTHDFGGLTANIDPNNRHDDHDYNGIEKTDCKPTWNKQQSKSRAKGARCFGCKTRAKSHATECDYSVGPRHLFEVNGWFMQNADIPEILVYGQRRSFCNAARVAQ